MRDSLLISLSGRHQPHRSDCTGESPSSSTYSMKQMEKPAFYVNIMLSLSVCGVVGLCPFLSTVYLPYTYIILYMSSVIQHDWRISAAVIPGPGVPTNSTWDLEVKLGNYMDLGNFIIWC